MTKTFSSKSNAKRAAQAELGANAVEAEDYKVSLGADGRWQWTGLKKTLGDSHSAKSGARRTPRAEGDLPISESRKGSTRPDSKQARLIAMLQTQDGATVAEIAAAFGWQPHTVRGAIAGALKKRLGLVVASEKVEGRGRIYRITA